jgi:N-acetylglucosaminyldiphosphoundecaprenol N-acetyl-beta-D-mannosaminyltransferase
MKWFSVSLPALTWAEAVKRLADSRIVYTPNPEILLEASRDAEFAEVLNRADLLLPDGHGLQIVSELRRFPRWVRIFLMPFYYVLYLLRLKSCRGVYPEVIHGSDFMIEILKRAKSVFFLGAAPGVAEAAAERAQKEFPHLKTFFSGENPGTKAVALIREARPEWVLVAYGAPKQEFFIDQAARELPEVPHFMGVGGSFDYYAGTVKRAPKIMQILGLEWLFRLFLEPRKRARRIWNALVVFPLKSVFYETT